MEKAHSARKAIHDFALMTIEYMPNLSGYNYFDRLVAHDAISCCQEGHAHQLLAQDIGENERCHDAGV